MVLFFYTSLVILRILLLLAIIWLLLSFIVRNSRLRGTKAAKSLILNRGLILLFIILLFALNYIRRGFFYSHLEWNPISKQSNVVGTWEKNDASLTFDPNGFVYFYGKHDHCLMKQKCNWSFTKEDSKIKIKNIKGETVWVYRLITFFGEYRIIYECDPDAVVTLGFSKVPQKEP